MNKIINALCAPLNRVDAYVMGLDDDNTLQFIIRCAALGAAVTLSLAAIGQLFI